MGCFSLVLIVLMSGFCQDANGIKPKMTPDIDEIFLDEYDDLKIECYSKDARIQFSFPESTFSVYRSDHEIRVSGNGTYTFLRRSAEVNDAGWYACAEEGVKIDNDFRIVNHTDKDVSWIYVYVKDTEGDTGFVYRDSGLFAPTIISLPGSVVVIPCRPTQPTTKVELRQDFRLVDLDKEAVRFDPKIGFIIEQVEFSENRAVFHCTTGTVLEAYILLFSESRPTMITPEEDKDVTLQEGEVLRIECSSESKLSFLYPTILTNSSEYEIAEYRNGTSTFRRRSVVSDDTGWYGCAGMDIGNDDISAISINYTKKEISWVYVYVNSPVKIISPPVDTVDFYLVDGPMYLMLPCRPTTPESHIYLERWNGKIWHRQLYGQFDPRFGYFGILWTANEQSVYRCVMTKPVFYVSKNYSLADIEAAKKQLQETAVILQVDDPSNSDDLIIRMTGDDLRLRCETVLPASSADFMRWSVPNTVLANRIKYNRTRSDGRIHFDVLYSRRNTLEITVTNLSETDSGDYTCRDLFNYLTEKDSRTVEVFDEAGGRYLRLGEQNNNLHLTGRNGATLTWLLDLTDYLSATIRKYCYFNHQVFNIRDVFQIRTASRHGSPLLLFTIKNVTQSHAGWYRVFFDYMHGALEVGINVDVQEPPIARMRSWERLSQTGKMRIDVRCGSLGSPEPNVTIVIEECPKYPSLENCSLKYGRGSYEVFEMIEQKIYYRDFHISMSGILSCKACNILGCDVTTEHIQFFASDEPYFTHTNLNHNEVVIDVATRVSGEPIILECYAAGNPYPNVTWFKNGVKLNDSRQYKFAYDNRQLSITYYFGDEGGRYSCRAENVYDFVESYLDIRLTGSSDQETGFSTSVIAVIVTLLVLVVISCVISYRLYLKLSRKKLSDLAFEKGAPERFNPALSVVDQADLLPYDLKWEYPRGLLKLDKTLGSGAFGIVRKAEAKSICRGEAVTTVAVKLVRSTATLNFMTALTRELKILAYLGKHPNVVNLLGACTKNVFYGELYVIVEYCRFGNLRDHLLSGRADFVEQSPVVSEDVDSSSLSPGSVDTNDTGLNTNVNVGEGSSATDRRCQGTSITGTSEVSDEDGDLDQDSGEAQRLRSKYDGDSTNLDVEPISTRDLVYWSWQVSRAMEFLGERRIVHGDLAARNILLADNGIVKVCDFGLAKALYKEAQYRDTGSNPLPVKWMAIESIKDQIFSVESDIWSFGIVMWEIFSLGETPYPGMRQRGLIQKLIDGYRMGRPKYAAMTIYEMMQKCWDADPTKRPSFADLSNNVGDSLDYDFKTQYLEMHAHYMEMNADIADNEKADYLTLSVDAVSNSRMREQIEMNSLPQDVSETAV